jgi:hypothetical protein
LGPAEEADYELDDARDVLFPKQLGHKGRSIVEETERAGVKNIRLVI